MNGTMVFAGVIIFIIVSWLTSFVNELNDDVDVSYGFHEKALLTGDNSNYTVDMNGKKVLQLDTLSMQEKRNLWNSSILKEDMLAEFPNFSEIHYIVNNQVKDEGLFKKKLLNHINAVQEAYIGGTLSDEQAKLKLSNF
jgi:hypothetical protein